MHAAAPPMPISKGSRRRWYVVGGFAIVTLATPFLYLLVSDKLRERELEQIYAEMDAEDPHWRWADLIKQLPPAPPDERNAMVQLRKVVGMMKATPFGTGPFANKAPEPVNARLTGAEEQRLRAALASLALNVLEEAYKLKDMPEGQISVDPSISPFEGKVVSQETLEVARLLRHDAMLRAHVGEMDEAADACLAMVRSAHAIGDFPGLLAQLIRAWQQQEAVAAIERALAQGVVDEKRLEAIQDALAIEADHNGPLHALRGERAFGHHIYLALRDGKISSRQITEDMALRVRPLQQVHALFPGILLRGYPERLRMQNAMVRATHLKDETQTEALRNHQKKKLDYGNPLDLGMIFILQHLDAERSRTIRVRCAVASLAAERYRLRYSDWPLTAADLVQKGLLKEWPKDTFDDQPLRFRRTPTGFVVYSIGADKIDNLGKIHRDNTPAPGTDVGVELWLPSFRGVAAPAEEEVPKK